MKISEIKKIKHFQMPRNYLDYIFPRETLDTTSLLSCPIFYDIASFNFASQSTFCELCVLLSRRVVSSLCMSFPRF